PPIEEQQDENQPPEQPAAPPPNPPVDANAILAHLAQVLNGFLQPNQNAPPPALAHSPPAQASVAMPAPAPAPAYDAPLPPPPPPRPYKSTLPDFIKSNRYFDRDFGKPDEGED